ncbi:hypothetical protein BHE74_00055629 [Ensete ventricosum]|nr:hypothetical protein BHE74_00055629 [Ensete ventricosum]
MKFIPPVARPPISGSGKFTLSQRPTVPLHWTDLAEEPLPRCLSLSNQRDATPQAEISENGGGKEDENIEEVQFGTIKGCVVEEKENKAEVR